MKAFYDKVVKARSGCWHWAGPIAGKGYGVLYMDGRAMYAHRLSWMLHHGDIPAGMLVCHRCDNPPCVNPAHLFLGTYTDNRVDMLRKGRGWGVKLTPKNVLEIRTNPQRPRKYFAKKFGISITQVSYIRHRKMWTWLED